MAKNAVALALCRIRRVEGWLNLAQHCALQQTCVRKMERYYAAIGKLMGW